MNKPERIPMPPLPAQDRAHLGDRAAGGTKVPPYDFGGSQGRYPRCSRDGGLCGAGGYCSGCPARPKPGLSRGLLVAMTVYVAVLVAGLLLAHWVAS